MKAKKSLESAALIAVSLLITACGRAPRTAAQWEQIDMEAADAHQLARAVEARDAFASRLMGKLTGAIRTAIALTASGMWGAASHCDWPR